MNFNLEIKSYVTQEKTYIGENSLFYKMKNDKGDEAVLKMTSYENINQLEFNTLFESEIIEKMSKFEGFPKLIDCGRFDVYSYSLMS